VACFLRHCVAVVHLVVVVVVVVFVVVTVDWIPCAIGALAPPTFAMSVCAECIAGVETSTTAVAR